MKRLDELDLPEGHRFAIQLASARLRERFPVDRIVLFGSNARGESAPESDIDLLVLTNRPLPAAARRDVVATLYPLQLEYNVVFSPLIVTSDEWTTGLYHVLPIHAEIERDGVAA